MHLQVIDFLCTIYLYFFVLFIKNAIFLSFRQYWINFAPVTYWLSERQASKSVLFSQTYMCTKIWLQELLGMLKVSAYIPNCSSSEIFWLAQYANKIYRWYLIEYDLEATFFLQTIIRKKYYFNILTPS